MISNHGTFCYKQVNIQLLSRDDRKLNYVPSSGRITIDGFNHLSMEILLNILYTMYDSEVYIMKSYHLESKNRAISSAFNYTEKYRPRTDSNKLRRKCNWDLN